MQTLVRLALVALALLLAGVLDVCAEEARSVSEWLRAANTALTSSDYAGALDAFDHAIALDPDAYLSYFRRATAQQALGRTAAALADLEAARARHPSFAKAYVQEAKLLRREGEYARAADVLAALAAHAPADADADALKRAVQHDAKLSARLAKLPTDARHATECIAFASELLKDAPNDLAARRHRAACHVAQGALDDAVSDWNRVAALAPSPALQRRLALLSYYVLGTYDSQMQRAGLAHLKACLHNDPDNRACRQAHKQLRRISKALGKAHQFADARSWTAVVSALKGPKVGGPTVLDEVQQVLADAQAPDADGEPLLPRGVRDAAAQSALVADLETLYCRAYSGQQLFKKAMPFCDKLLARDPHSVPALVARGEDHLANGRYDEAVAALNDAFVHSHHDRDVHARLVKAQKLLKQSKSKDYYKTLGVARDADERTIKKAYRRLAREHHPDKGGSQEKMAEINEAFGVLGDAELRARYDQGDDPNDPTGGQANYGDAYAHGDAFQQMFQNAAFQQFARQHGGQFGGGGAQFHWGF